MPFRWSLKIGYIAALVGFSLRQAPTKKYSRHAMKDSVLLCLKSPQPKKKTPFLFMKTRIRDWEINSIIFKPQKVFSTVNAIKMC